MTQPEPTGALHWPPLIPGVLVRRYKRFLADIRLEDGSVATAHCPNSGSMTACCEPGRPVYISRQDSPKRKLKYTWELIDMGSSLVGVNTQVPNRLVAESIRAGRAPELTGYGGLRREAAVGGSRIDMVLGEGERSCYVEVKNCTLVEDGQARFPDAVTARGLKHLVELQRLVEDGRRCVMFFLIQRMDADRFGPADDIDPAYGRELRRAAAAGVEVLAYDVRIDLTAISLNRRVETTLG